jgi:hypothetical protein
VISKNNSAAATTTMKKDTKLVGTGISIASLFLAVAQNQLSGFSVISRWFAIISPRGICTARESDLREIAWSLLLQTTRNRILAPVARE